MEIHEVVNGRISNGIGVVSCSNGLEKVCNENGSVEVDAGEKVEGNVAEVLEDWEEYWDDINDRLMISRMVSNSVIKGMVTAVEQEAAERIAAKELELASLKKCLQSAEVCACKLENVRLPVVQKVYEVGEYGKCSCSMEACKKNKKMREDLNSLRNSAREQFKKFKDEVEFVRGSNSMKKVDSVSELLVGLGEILHEQQSENWMPTNKMLDNLEKTLDTFCRKVDDIMLSSNVPICESRQDLDLLTTLEDVVRKTALGSLQEEYQENLLEQSAQFCGIQNMNWLEKFNNISSLGTKLDAILKSLSVHEAELASHGSHDLDNLLQKACGNHCAPIAHYGENGAVDASNIHVAESYNFDQLKHMSTEEMVCYFNGIVTKMKRDHESALHQRTEEHFRLKRDYLKLKDSFTKDRKDEEFDVLRKKIPEVILKLEDFLLENERFPALTKNLDSLGKLKSKIESLLSENRDLRDRWADKENEVKNLKAQVSGAASELLQRSLAEENLLKLVGSHKSKVEDSHIEASLNEEVYKCALREQICKTRQVSEDSNMKFVMTQEIYDIILREAASPAETANIHGIDDSEVESLIGQELNVLILTKAVRDSRRQLDDLCQKIIEKENELKLEAAEMEKLKQEILDLRTVVEQKEKFVIDLSVSLPKEREQFELASRELASLREHASQLQALVTESNKDIESLMSQYFEALDQIELEKMEMLNLSQKLDQTKVVLAEANKERDKAFVVAQEMHDKLLSNKAREQTLKMEMEMAANGFSKIISDFECRVSGSIKRNGLRLKDTTSDLKALTEMANEVRRTGLMYKNKLDKRCIDLQMAESEVDLLGDEVDALIRLLEKIYIALDHYSPVLKHYPGIIEILELVRRELTGKLHYGRDQPIEKAC